MRGKILTVLLLLGGCSFENGASQTGGGALADLVRNKYSAAKSVSFHATILANRVGGPCSDVDKNGVPVGNVLRVIMADDGTYRRVLYNRDHIEESPASPHWGINRSWVGKQSDGLNFFLDRLAHGVANGNTVTVKRSVKRCSLDDSECDTIFLEDTIDVNVDGTIASWMLTAYCSDGSTQVMRHKLYDEYVFDSVVGKDPIMLNSREHQQGGGSAECVCDTVGGGSCTDDDCEHLCACTSSGTCALEAS